MRIFIAFFLITFFGVSIRSADAQESKTKTADTGQTVRKPDSVKLVAMDGYAYYQGSVKADSIPEGIIYVRAMQFMAAKNFQQNYGYEQEGKLIYTTSQDLNINAVYIGDENDVVNPYTAQFSIMLDLKNFRYRYTINNVVIFLPTDNGNKRETLYDIYLKATTHSEGRRTEKVYKSIIDSFERYISALLTELHESIDHKLPIYSSKF